MKNAILELKQGIDEKTKKLIELKARYNEMVEKICKELNESVERLNDAHVNIPLNVANNVLFALKYDHSKIPSCVRDLQKILDGKREDESTQINIFFEEEENFNDDFKFEEDYNDYLKELDMDLSKYYHDNKLLKDEV